jgi:hypothetical protein
MTKFKPKAVLADMDGTLANVSSVRFHVDGSVTKPKASGGVKVIKNFDAFHAASEFVPANQQAIDFCVRANNQGYRVLIVTARMRKWEGVTTRFLERTCREFFDWEPHIYMRTDGDHRKDVEVKREIFAEISQSFDVVGAVDDNPAIITLWEEMGIPEIEIVPGWDHDAAAKAAALINAAQ